LNRERRRLEARQSAVTSASGSTTRERLRIVDAESETLPAPEGAASETDARNVKRKL
jgi:hypothetical protein